MSLIILFEYKLQKVTYYGDCSTSPQQLDSGVLNDYRQLMDQGQKVGSDLSLRKLTESVE